MMQCGLAGSVSPPRWLPDGKAQICQILLPCALLAFVLFIFSPASPLDFSSQALSLLFRISNPYCCCCLCREIHCQLHHLGHQSSSSGLAIGYQSPWDGIRLTSHFSSFCHPSEIIILWKHRYYALSVNRDFPNCQFYPKVH